MQNMEPVLQKCQSLSFKKKNRSNGFHIALTKRDWNWVNRGAHRGGERDRDLK